MKTSRRRYYAIRKQRRIRLLLSILFLSFVVFGGISLVGFYRESFRTNRLNEEISREYMQDKVNSDQEMSDDPFLDTQRNSFSDQIDDAATLVVNTQEGASGGIPREASSDAESSQLSQYYQFIGNSIQESMQKLYKRNNDLVGWLSIKGVLYLPVVYRDNKYYLDHDFDGKKNKSGTIFLDENHPFSENTQHLVIHGHDMVDGSMFGLLLHYRNINYIKEHGIINFNTLFEDEKYVVYAVLVVSTDVHSNRYFPYVGITTFSTVNEFDYYITQAQSMSMFHIPVSIEPSDALLTLSTCLDDDRILVMFRRIRDGENEEELQNSLFLTRTRNGLS